MHIKLLRSVLVEDHHTMPTRDGTKLHMDDAKAREFIANGLAEEVKAKAPVEAPPPAPAPAAEVSPEAKKAPEPENKKAPEPANKSKTK